mgnify:CR=1 FL=1
MKSYNIAKDCKAIRTMLKMSQTDFAKEIGVSFSTINRIENNRFNPLESTIEKIYSLGYKSQYKNMFINKAKSSVYLDEYKNVLFHGTDVDIDGELDLDHSRDRIDFGKGFYTGETYESTRDFVSYKNKISVYAFKFDPKNLSILNMDVSLEWALAVSYYRGMLKEYENSKKLHVLIKKIESYDVVVAPIADNAMFDLINQFARGDISDVQLSCGMSASYLGMQYIFRKEKALSHLEFIDRLYVSSKEHEDARKNKNDANDLGSSKAEMCVKEHRHQGRYIEDILYE